MPAFAQPAALVALALGVPLAVVLAVWAERRRSAALAAFGDPRLLARASALPSRRARALGWTLRLSALACVLLALARPTAGAAPTTTARSGRDLVVALDVSRSMLAEDAGGPRLAAAKRIARAVLEASPGDRVALVVFGRSAFVSLPFTLDRAAVERALEAASPASVPDPGTSVAGALAAAVAAFERASGGPADEAGAGHRAVLLLSDGEDQTGDELAGDLDRASTALRHARARVVAVGLGSADGATIPSRDDHGAVAPHLDRLGRAVVTVREEAVLRYAARETGGAYAAAEAADALARVQAALARVGTREIRGRTVETAADRFRWPLGLAVVLLVAEAWLRARPARKGTAV
jgi:Ca-activated chloride channel family protein